VNDARSARRPAVADHQEPARSLLREVIERTGAGRRLIFFGADGPGCGRSRGLRTGSALRSAQSRVFKRLAPCGYRLPIFEFDEESSVVRPSSVHLAARTGRGLLDSDPGRCLPRPTTWTEGWEIGGVGRNHRADVQARCSASDRARRPIEVPIPVDACSTRATAWASVRPDRCDDDGGAESIATVRFPKTSASAADQARRGTAPLRSALRIRRPSRAAG